MVPIRLKNDARIFGQKRCSGEIVFVHNQMAEALVKEGDATELPQAEREEMLRKAGISGGQVRYAAYIGDPSNGSSGRYR